MPKGTHAKLKSKRPMKERLADPTAWTFGAKYSYAIQQFQILYEEYGWKTALEWSEDMILWPDLRRPEEIHMYKWALQFDLGEAKIDEELRLAFKKRMQNMLRATAIATVRLTSQASRDYSRLLSKTAQQLYRGQPTDEANITFLKENSSNYMHANNGTGFVYREVIGEKEKDRNPRQGVTFEGGFTLNVGQKPLQVRRKDMKQLRNGDVPIEADYTVVA